MREVLEKLGYGGRLHYTFVPGASHDEDTWRARSPAIPAIFEGP